jgi:hypothetical protein
LRHDTLKEQLPHPDVFKAQDLRAQILTDLGRDSEAEAARAEVSSQQNAWQARERAAASSTEPNIL